MKDFPGTPGTPLGLALRTRQFAFASASILYMATTPNFMDYMSFSFLILAMGVQAVWSFCMGLMGLVALARKKAFDGHLLLFMFVLGDGMAAMLSLAGASLAAGISMLYFFVMGYCGCDSKPYLWSIALASLGWAPLAVSSLIMLWAFADSVG